MSNWYILQTYSNSENKVVEGINEIIKKHNLQDYFTEILVPTQDISQLRFGKPIIAKKKILPGYVLLNMTLDERLYSLIRALPRVSGFLGHSSNKSSLPFPVSQAEIDKLMHGFLDSSIAESDSMIVFYQGESLKITDGPFESFTGVVEGIDKDRKKLTVSVSIFGRATPVELEYNQVEKIES